MGNTDKFEMIANKYDTSERIQIAKVSSDAIREYLVDAKCKNAIDFGYRQCNHSSYPAPQKCFSAASRRYGKCRTGYCGQY